MSVDMSLLHPKLQKLAEELFTACERKGLRIKYTQGYRSKAEQDALYAQGRTRPGNIVTKAKGGYSMHNWGVAIDFCRNDGKAAFDDSDGFFEKIGQIGKALGLEWGGDWITIKDRPHFQLPDWGSTTTKLRSTYGTFERFKATWIDLLKEKPVSKYGDVLPKKKYEVLKNCYVRKLPGGDKVKFKNLDEVTQPKCTPDSDGYAKWKKGKRFDRIRKYTGSKGNTWYQTAKGWWIPAIMDGERRVKAV